MKNFQFLKAVWSPVSGPAQFISLILRIKLMHLQTAKALHRRWITKRARKLNLGKVTHNAEIPEQKDWESMCNGTPCVYPWISDIYISQWFKVPKLSSELPAYILWTLHVEFIIIHSPFSSSWTVSPLLRQRNRSQEMLQSSLLSELLGAGL